MKVTLIQMSSQPDKAHNLAQAAGLLEDAIADTHPDMVMLPELFTFLGGSAADAGCAAETLPGGKGYELLRETAMRHRVNVHGGSMAVREGDKLYNCTLVFDREGKEIAQYRKIHMFDVVTPDGKAFCESQTYAHGSQIVDCEIDGVPMGHAICYDLRFGELFVSLAKKGVRMIAVPAAFTMATGKDHWEVLLRARAVETQCYILASGQTGNYVADGIERSNYGNSMIVDPWGTVIARAQDRLGWTSATLDFEFQDKVRGMVPSNQNRILESYGI